MRGIYRTRLKDKKQEKSMKKTIFAALFAIALTLPLPSLADSYKWAEVLDADAFSVFKKNGIFDRKTAQSFRDNILSKGGTEHPMTLYKRFRGQEPTIDALLERNGIKRQ